MQQFTPCDLTITHIFLINSGQLSNVSPCVCFSSFLFSFSVFLHSCISGWHTPFPPHEVVAQHISSARLCVLAKLVKTQLTVTIQTSLSSPLYEATQNLLSLIACLRITRRYLTYAHKHVCSAATWPLIVLIYDVYLSLQQVPLSSICITLQPCL